MVKRYRFMADGQNVIRMVSVTGPYVDYDDHAAEVSRLEAENKRLREQIKFLDLQVGSLLREPT